MRKTLYALIVLGLLASQVIGFIKPITAQAVAQAAVETPKIKSNLKLNTESYSAIELDVASPNFDTDVLAPLRAKQAARAQAALAAQAKPKRVVIAKTVAVRVATGDVWEALRMCEAGGDYTKNTGNGYYGAYQYNLSTWGNYGGYARPDLAPPAVQDAKARETQARRGWSPWPTCARKLGLL